MHEVLLEGRDLVKTFPVRKAPITGKVLESLTAVSHVSAVLEKEKTLGIVGESGSGKSTLGELLGDLQRPDTGSVLYKGRNIREMSAEQYRTYRRNVQFVFQDPKGSMNPNRTIEQILTEPLLTLRIEKDSAARSAKARELCAQIGLEEAVLRKYPSELSGGQCQRIVIARALITEPEILICDEAVSALDVSVQAQILNLLRDLQRMHHTAYLFISHDIGAVHYMADHVLVMKKGCVVEQGEAEKVLKNPETAYTKELLRSSFARFEN